jgi:hypothetical protein
VHLISVYPQHSYASAFLPSVTVAVGKVFILSSAIDCQMRTSQRAQTLIHSEHVVPRLEAVVPLLVERFGVCAIRRPTVLSRPSSPTVMTLHPCNIKNSPIPRTDGDRHPLPRRQLSIPGDTSKSICDAPAFLPVSTHTHRSAQTSSLYRLRPRYHSPFKWRYMERLFWRGVAAYSRRCGLSLGVCTLRMAYGSIVF